MAPSCAGGSASPAWHRQPWRARNRSPARTRAPPYRATPGLRLAIVAQRHRARCEWPQPRPRACERWLRRFPASALPQGWRQRHTQATRRAPEEQRPTHPRAPTPPPPADARRTEKRIGSSSGSCSLSGGLDERNFVDLFQGGQAALHAVNGRFAQKAHAFPLCQLANLRSRFLFQNQLADRVGQVEQFMDGGAAPVACAAALNAARALVEVEVAPLRRIHA